MDLPHSLAADFAALTAALDLPEADLAESLTALARDTRLAVPSFLGLSIAVTVNADPISFTIFDPAEDPASALASIFIPIGQPDDANRTSVVFYASTPGAFVDLAADVSRALGLPLADCVLDAHLRPVLPASGATDLDNQRLVNQAIGVLIDRGFDPDSASAELHRLAELDGGDVRHAARLVLDGLRRGPSADEQRGTGDER